MASNTQPIRSVIPSQANVAVLKQFAAIQGGGRFMAQLRDNLGPDWLRRLPSVANHGR